MVSESQWWKCQSCLIWMYHMQNFEEIKIWRSQVLILPVYPPIPKMVWENQDKVRWPSLIWLVQFAYRLVFQRDSESEEGNLYFSINHLITRIIYFNFEKYKFPSSDSESPWKTSLYAIWTSQIGDSHPTLSWFPNTILGIAGYTGRIRTWDLHILISSKFHIWYKLNHSNWTTLTFSLPAFQNHFG